VLCREVLSQSGEAIAASEFWVPRSHERADLVVIDSRIHGYEIKSEHDNLKRLPRQIGAYGRLFDRSTAVLAERHLEKALSILPPWWGVFCIHGGNEPTLIQLRQATDNPVVDPETLVRLLWRSEVHAALHSLGHEPAPGGRVAMWEQLLTIVTVPRLKLIVRSALLERDPARRRMSGSAVTVRPEPLTAQ
jgi:hypothetical protein